MTTELTQHNFSTYRECLLSVQFVAGWEKTMIDINQEVQAEWDGDQSRDSQEQISNRADAFAIMWTKINKDLYHLRTGTIPGDVKGFFRKIYQRFCSLTSGALQTLRVNFGNLSMLSTGYPLERFMSVCSERQDNLLRATGEKYSQQVHEPQLCSVIINGLLRPPFQPIQLLLSMKKPSDHKYDELRKVLINFASDNNLLSTRSNVRASQTALLINTEEKTQEECRNYAKHGKCKFGHKCRYQHKPRPGPPVPTTDAAKADKKKNNNPNNYPKGSCYNCGEKGHIAPKCPKKKAKSNTDKKKGEDADDTTVLMMQVQPTVPACVDQEVQPEKTTLHVPLSEMTRKAWLTSNHDNTINRDFFHQDSACTAHLINDMKHFIPGTVEEYHCRVLLGNGEYSAETSFIGRVRIVPADSSLPEFIADKVLYLPNAPTNILSEVIFDKKNLAILRFEGRAVTWKPTKGVSIEDSTILTAELDANTNLYRANCDSRGAIIARGGVSIFSKMGVKNVLKIQQRDAKFASTHRQIADSCFVLRENAPDAKTEDQPIVPQGNNEEHVRAQAPPSASPAKPPATQEKGAQVPQQEKFSATRAVDQLTILQEHYANGHDSLAKRCALAGVPFIINGVKLQCAACQAMDPKAIPKSRKKRPTTQEKIVAQPKRPLQQLQIDIMYLQSKSWEGNSYALVVVDVLTRYFWLLFLAMRRDALGKFVLLVKQLRNQKPHLPIGTVRSDNEFFTREWVEVLAEYGIVMNPTSAVTEKAWIAERTIGLLRRISEPQMKLAGAPPRAEQSSLTHAVYLLRNKSTQVLPEGCSRAMAFHIEDLSKLPEHLPPITQEEFIWATFCWAKVHRRPKGKDQWEPAIYEGKSPDFPGQMQVTSLNTNQGYRGWTQRTYFTKNIKGVDNNIFPFRDPQFRQQVSRLVVPDQDSAAPDAPGTLLGATHDMYSPQEIKEFKELARSVYPQLNSADAATAGEADSEQEPSSDELDEKHHVAGETRRREPSSKALENIVNEHEGGQLQTAFLIKAKKKRQENFYPIQDPQTDREAFASPQAQQWREADYEEFLQLLKRGTWTLVHPSEAKGKKIIGCRFIRKIKWKPKPEVNLHQKLFRQEEEIPLADSKAQQEPNRKPISSPTFASDFIIDKFKSRLVAQGFNMEKGVDFENSYSNNIAADTVRYLSALAAWYGFNTRSMDFKGFYLIGDLKDEIYMRQARGFEVKGKEDWLYKLLKTLYGLPQSGRLAQQKLIKIFVEKCEMEQSSAEPMLFLRHRGKEFVLGGWHVDDGMIVTNSDSLLSEIVEALNNNNIETTIQENTDKHLGIEYERDSKTGTITHHQENYCKKFLASLRIEDATRPRLTPMNPDYGREDDHWAPNNERTNANDYDTHKVYQGWCGQAIWMLQSKPYESFAINSLCRRMHASSKEDSKAMMNFGRYLLSNPSRGMSWHRGPEGKRPRIYAYTDASLYHMPVSGVAVFLGEPDFKTHINPSAAIICFSKRENLAVTSVFEAELMAMARGVQAIMYLIQVSEDAGFPQTEPAVLFTDSETAIRFLDETGRVPNRQTRHLRWRVQFIRDAIANNTIVLKHVRTDLNCADVLTKFLPQALHARHVANLSGQHHN